MDGYPTLVLLPGKSHGRRSLVGCRPWGCEELDTTERLHFTFPFHALEKKMATHSSVLAWRIPGMGEPGGLPSMGSHRVRHNWSDLAAAAAWMATIKNMPPKSQNFRNTKLWKCFIYYSFYQLALEVYKELKMVKWNFCSSLSQCRISILHITLLCIFCFFFIF